MGLSRRFGTILPFFVFAKAAERKVQITDIFDVNIANSTDKLEGPPPTGAGGASSSSTSTSVYTSGSSSRKKIATIAAIVGGFVGLILIGGIVAFCLIRRRRQGSKSATKLEPISTNFNHVPEDTRPTIPGFSHPGTPFVHFGALHSTPHYHVPNSANTSPHTGHPMSMGGTSVSNEMRFNWIYDLYSSRNSTKRLQHSSPTPEKTTTTCKIPHMPPICTTTNNLPSPQFQWLRQIITGPRQIPLP